MKNNNLAGIPASHKPFCACAKQFMALLYLLLFAGCDVQQDVKSLAANSDTKRVWVFVQVNVPGKDSIEDYYYTGRVSASLYKQMSENRLTRGFILLNDVLFYGDDKKYHQYEDAEDSGSLVFRLEDVRRINLLKKSPMVEDDKPSKSSSDTKPTRSESSASVPATSSSDASTANK